MRLVINTCVDLDIDAAGDMAHICSVRSCQYGCFKGKSRPKFHSCPLRAAQMGAQPQLTLENIARRRDAGVTVAARIDLRYLHNAWRSEAVDHGSRKGGCGADGCASSRPCSASLTVWDFGRLFLNWGDGCHTAPSYFPASTMLFLGAATTMISSMSAIQKTVARLTRARLHLHRRP